MPTRPVNDLDAEHVRSILDYDAIIGVLRWRPNPARSKAWNSRHANKAAGSPNPRTGVQIRIDGKLYLGHRLVWLVQTGQWPAEEVDHRNGNRIDNRWENLREATHLQNMHNVGLFRNNTSGFAGVRYRPHHGKWEARIYINRKVVWRAYTTTAQEAGALRRAALPKYHGKFVRET